MASMTSPRYPNHNHEGHRMVGIVGIQVVLRVVGLLVLGLEGLGVVPLVLRGFQGMRVVPVVVELLVVGFEGVSVVPVVVPVVVGFQGLRVVPVVVVVALAALH